MIKAYVTAPQFGDKILGLNVGEFQIARENFDEIMGVFPDSAIWRINTLAFGIMYIRQEGFRWVEVPSPNA
jgi:hypothetical protein